MTLRRTLLALPLAALLVLPACEEKKPPAPPPPPPPAPKVEAPAPPKPVDIATVLQQARADARVQFPKDHAPVDRTLAEAVIQLASALAKGDDKALAPLLAPGAKSVLESLTKSGDWARGTKGIEAVRVVSLSAASEDKPTTSNVGLAIQMPGEAFLLGWTANKAGNTWTFKNAWAEAGTKTRASEFDGSAVDTSAAASASDATTGLDKVESGGRKPPSDERLAYLYLAHEMSRELYPPDNHAAAQQRMKQRLNLSDEDLKQMLAKARGLVERGVLPDAALLARGVEQTALATGKSVDEILKKASQILGVSVQKLKELIEKGKAAPAPSREDASTEPEAPSKGPKRAPTPVGPVTIPGSGGGI